MIKVLLVEDHASYRQAIETVIQIEDGMEVAGHASSLSDAVGGAWEVDVALIDIDLRGQNGVGAITAIRERRPGVACVVLSAISEDAILGQAIEAGASAVLHKSVDIPYLLDIIRRVGAGETFLPPAATSRRLQALAASRNDQWHGRMMRERITAREHEVLQLLATGQGNRQIAQTLGISPETVQTHVRNILSKLAAESRLAAVAKALRYRLVEPPG